LTLFSKFKEISTNQEKLVGPTAQLSIESQASEVEHMISLIVPVYNEESKISALVAHVKDILRESLHDYEILIINDGSTDNTMQLIEVEKKLDNRVKAISYVQNEGKGHAVKTGVLESSGDIVLFLDGDFDISPNEIRNYIKELDGCDLVIASKAHPLSNVVCPSHRRLLSKLYSLFVRVIVGIRVKDTQSGLKVGNGNTLRKIFEYTSTKGYAFDVELLALATRFDLKIKELPININLSSSFRIHEIAKMFIDTLRISYKLRIRKSYKKHLQETF